MEETIHIWQILYVLKEQKPHGQYRDHALVAATSAAEAVAIFERRCTKHISIDSVERKEYEFFDAREVTA